MSEDCIFCRMATNPDLPHLVHADALTMAFIDLRQFHPGHTIVMPRQHYQDVRELDYQTGAALMATVTMITRAVSAAFPSEGISLWHSIGPAAFQEVPHLHIHVHPRRLNDDVLRVYPSKPPTPEWSVLRERAAAVRACLASLNTQNQERKVGGEQAPGTRR
jgi:histidine triad (HIT) family protein